VAVSSLVIVSGEGFPKPRWSASTTHFLDEAADLHCLRGDANALSVTFYCAGRCPPGERVGSRRAEVVFGEGLGREGLSLVSLPGRGGIRSSFLIGWDDSMLAFQYMPYL
jgi:hypothetical protein